MGSALQVLRVNAAATALEYAAPGAGTTSFAKVATSEATTSGVFVDLATVGPAVTVTVPASGIVRVTLGTSTTRIVGDSDQSAFMGVALSGANTVAANQNDSAATGLTANTNFSRTLIFSGLTPGSTTFTAKYRIDDGSTSTSFANRLIIVETLP